MSYFNINVLCLILSFWWYFIFILSKKKRCGFFFEQFVQEPLASATPIPQFLLLIQPDQKEKKKRGKNILKKI